MVVRCAACQQANAVGSLSAFSTGTTIVVVHISQRLTSSQQG
jgi:hypothetical protein